MAITTTIPKSPPPTARREAEPNGPPPLQSGDRLTREEFERRYELHPEIKKAELIEGVVYVPSPVRIELHSEPHGTIIAWLVLYRAATPGVKPGPDATVRLDDSNEPQPDALLRLKPEFGGAARVSADGYLEGPPELVVEVAASSASYDLHGKLGAYQRNGVREYLVLEVYERRTHWFSLQDGVFEEMPPEEGGVLKSQVFPGLWLSPEAFWNDDLDELFAVLQQGLASPEHADFVARLRSSQQGSEPASD